MFSLSSAGKQCREFFEELRVFDAGDVEFTLDWKEYFARTDQMASELLDTGKFCIFLGGDHSVTIPLSKALSKHFREKKVGIIHFDSHPDLCDEYEGSKLSHACPLLRLLENGIDPRDLAQVGIRSYEKEEILFYEKHPETMVIKAYDVFRDGYASVAEMLVAKFIDYDAVYITLDIDVLDPAFAPGTGTPEPGGLSSKELIYIINQIMCRTPVMAMDIVEVSPPLDTGNQITSWAAAKIIYEVFRKIYERRLNTDYSMD